jgi:hypothetical protein
VAMALTGNCQLSELGDHTLDRVDGTAL